ncbi:MAG: exosome complex protein Rrp42 [Candidatus Micrarchaeota archaeon]|nr:exosome complex protein Rrp42 [Candidatus Micrarchaeota archaeon]
MILQKEEILKHLRKEGLRFDERAPYEYRPIRIEKNVIETAEGSALAKIGETVVIAGIKVEVGELFEKDKANFITSAELSPMASLGFEPGPPDERSIEIARVIDRGFRSAEVLALDKLVIEEGIGYTIFLDLYILNHDGNMLDTGYLAGMAALTTLKIPKYEDGELIRDEFLNENFLQNYVTSSTFATLEEFHLLDPNESEENVSDAMLLLAVDDEHIVSAQKMKEGSYKPEEILDLVDVTFKKRKDILKVLKGED